MRSNRQSDRGAQPMLSLALIAGTAALGLLIRFAPVGLPWAVQKYGGSVLWAAMVYWIVSAILGKRSCLVSGLIAEAIAVAVELFKRVHSPGLDRFRQTLPGILLLGRQFSYADIVAYSTAILFAALLDAALRQRLRR